ncbi:MAG: hypothetical protein QM594_07025 [Niabella sp.]
MSKLFKSLLMLSLLTGSYTINKAQLPVPKPTVSVWDGMVVAGYVNHGAYINFGGPGIKLVKKPCSILIGMLPSVRIKEDKVAAGAKKNSIVTPSLGAGISFAYKHLALQVPVYYNAKTSTDDGKWNVGIGAGFKF